MATKTLGTLAIFIICLLLFPVVIGIIGGAFGIVMGVFGAIFGTVFGLIGGLFGIIFGFVGWLFGALVDWDHSYTFFDLNFGVVILITIIIFLLVKRKNQKHPTK